MHSNVMVSEEEYVEELENKLWLAKRETLCAISAKENNMRHGNKTLLYLWNYCNMNFHNYRPLTGLYKTAVNVLMHHGIDFLGVAYGENT